MMLASTIVPRDTFNPFSSDTLTRQKELVTQIVIFHQVAKFADGTFIGTGSSQIGSDKQTHRSGVIKGFFGSGIGQLEPML